MKKYLLILILIVYMTISSVPCKAATAEDVTGSAVTADNAETYLQKEFEDVTAKKIFKVYIDGVLVGFGLCSVVYIIGIGIGTAYAVLTKL